MLQTLHAHTRFFGAGAVLLLAQGAPAQCPASWSEVAPLVSPSPRVSHAMAYDMARDRVVLFGGMYETHLGDTWEFDGVNWALAAEAGPSPREGAMMAYDPVRRVCVLFGGLYVEDIFDYYYGDTWEWNGSVWNPVAYDGPAPRSFGVLTYDAARGRMVLFGGKGADDEFFGDTWEWDGTTWSQVASTGPHARAWHAMAHDRARARTVLFGGYHEDLGFPTYLGDTWEWNGTAWSRRASGGPPARDSHAMAFHDARGSVVLFGGYGEFATDTTWEWNGASWLLRAAAGPFERAYHAMVYDSARARVVLWGGDDGVYFHTDTWTWSGATRPAVLTHPEPVTVSPGRSALFTVAASGTAPLSYRWRRGGVNLINGAGISGVFTPNLLISPVSVADAGVYDCVVTNGCGPVTSAAAALTVTCPADFNHDGTLDFFDYDDFVTCFEGAACVPGTDADFNADGTVDFFDYDDFALAFERGC